MAFTPTRRHLLKAGAAAIGGFALGLALSSIPSPEDVHVFWVGNFSSPWPVLAFFAGWWQRDRLWALGTGALAEVGCVVGFYGRFLSLDPMRYDLPRSTGVVQVAAASLTHWAAFVAPWGLIALASGLLYGGLGGWWGRSRSVVAGLALGVPFLLEPLAWPVSNGYFKGPLILDRRDGDRCARSRSDGHGLEAHLTDRISRHVLTQRGGRRLQIRAAELLEPSAHDLG
jgi:hypothetical protein